MTAIHQFVPTLAPRDAVGTHYLAVQTALRDAGYRSDIFAAEAKEEYAGLAQPFQSFDGGRRGEATWLLYHASIGSTVADFVATRDEPLIVDYHNITPPEFFQRWEPVTAAMLMRGRRQLADLQSRTSLGLADSAYNAQELTSFGFAPTAVVPILLDIATLDATAPDPSITADGRTTWCFVGRLAPNKAQHDLVKAFAAYRKFFDPDARLRLVGGASSHSYQQALESFIAALGLTGAVEITGAVTHAQLMAYYATADVFVVCSEHEGFCVPLLEAMHHGVPIVAYASTAVPETLGDAGIVLRSKAPCTVAEAVHRVVANSALRAQLVDAGRRRVATFTLAAARKKLLDAITPVVGAP